MRDLALEEAVKVLNDGREPMMWMKDGSGEVLDTASLCMVLFREGFFDEAMGMWYRELREDPPTGERSEFLNTYGLMALWLKDTMDLVEKHAVPGQRLHGWTRTAPSVKDEDGDEE